MKKNQCLNQFNVINFLNNGYYDGFVTVNDVLEKGNFGLGTYHALEGEMIVYDGVAYQVRNKGHAEIANNQTLVPYATVTYFKPEIVVNNQAILTKEEILSIIQQKLENKNIFYSILIKGLFQEITIRNVVKQSKPYRPLAELADTEDGVVKKDITGVLVGYWGPLFAQEIIGSGFHFHFISDDKKTGGHVHNFSIKNSIIEIMINNKMEMVLKEN